METVKIPKPAAGRVYLEKLSERKTPQSPNFSGLGKLKPEDVELIKTNGGYVRLSLWPKVLTEGAEPYLDGFINAQDMESVAKIEEGKGPKEGNVSIHKSKPENRKSEKSPIMFGTGRLKPECIEKLEENGGEVRISGWGKIPKGGGEIFISGYIETKSKYETVPVPEDAADSFLLTPEIREARELVQETVYEDPEVGTDTVVQNADDLPF